MKLLLVVTRRVKSASSHEVAPKKLRKNGENDAKKKEREFALFFQPPEGDHYSFVPMPL